MICGLAQIVLDCFSSVLAVGLEIVSLWLLVTRAVARSGPETKQVRKMNRKMNDNMEVERLVLTTHRKGTHVRPQEPANYIYTE
jgi:hypothetical protein